jgi:hypothetical protein
MEYGTERQILSTAVEIEEDLGYRKKNKARGKNKQNPTRLTGYGHKCNRMARLE